MKANLFEGLSPNEILDNLQAENCGIEENYNYVKPFTEEEALIARDSMTEAMIGKSRINTRIKNLVEPLKDELKPIERQIKIDLRNLEQGGIETCDNLFCFPDYE